MTFSVSDTWLKANNEFPNKLIVSVHFNSSASHPFSILLPILLGIALIISLISIIL